VRPTLALRNPAWMLALGLASSALIRYAAFKRGVGRARALAAACERYERRLSAGALSILVLGDSTGVGVGASRPEESIAGRLGADFPDADIVNVSRSGARVGDAIAQAAECASLGLRFDMAVLHIGSNDVVRGTNAGELAADCETLMVAMARIADRTVWLGPPNVGLAPLFPPPYSWLVAARSRAAARIFACSAAKHEVAFIDFTTPEHAAHLGRNRQGGFAVDRFHPSSTTYGYGYAAAREAMGIASRHSTRV